ncbi:hypothetical protein BDV25DRAFT_139029 [Aspergillus avenaceus]|uniref:Uncharacterized protein n=1 Tax=Aspergillus avenaceus TaxID=36643 RepID=A0A5N6TXW4_ASPAV|nr:hypothetical protein BDV25DRAFT_139029 [Aspergillus avenaceus]
MIITPVMKEPQSNGYISPACPHAINSILMDDLGRDEVLLLATDSGNVCGYRVEAIFSALKLAEERKEQRPLDGTQVDPFFAEYVDASAWGLAIHKFARLIAVSANTGLITVFAFALVNPSTGTSTNASLRSEEEDEFTDYGHTWLEIKSDEQFAQLRQLRPIGHRKRNIRLTYTGHFTNIPSVAFLNCDLDPNGAWMVSTDIDNKLLVWNIWDRLGPYSLYHFNESNLKSYAEEAFRYDTERGWSVFALDPRTFHLLKSTEEACGGQPQRRLKDHQTILDLTKLSRKTPDTSQLYNFFPPAVKIEPEQPTLPDIFGSDCCISEEGSVRQATSHTECDDGSSERAGDGLGPSGSQDARNLRPMDSADAFSHRAVDGSVYEDTLGSADSSDVETFAGPQNGFNHEGEMPPVNRAFQQLFDDTPLTTQEFLQVALLEALGGDIPGAEEYFDDYSIEEVSPFEDENMTDMDDRSTEDDDTTTSGAVAYEDTLPPPPPNANFPIIHFSQTEIRLIAHPAAQNASVICSAPLHQPITQPIMPMKSCDRFNMVKYIPEHGIIVAASQKGRAAVITLTESETDGLSFRVDWIVPFESQEKYGDRPLIPLLGMSVGPMQGFEMPPDVPYIPHTINENGLSFNYKPYDDTGPSSQTSSFSKSFTHHHHPSDESHPFSRDSTPSFYPVSEPGHHLPFHQNQYTPLTLPECHAKATRAYQPQESWRGWNPSRRYRLLLYYADHTVMSYEFWYSWSQAATDETDEDGYLVI